MTANQTVFLEECSIKCLLSFIKNFIKDVNMCFGLKRLILLMQIGPRMAQKIPLISKSMNVANVPEIRLILDL